MSWLSEWLHPGNPAADAAAAQTAMLEKQQKQHDADVAAGKTSIDNAFAQFDQPYFDNYRQSYVGAYEPQLDDQYGQSKDKLLATLAGNGQLGGSVGNNATARLQKTYNDTQSDIANKGADAANGLKASVDNAKTGLYTLNASAADPLTMARQAQSTAGAIVSPQSYPTMSNVFADALGGVATASKANANSMNPAQFSSTWFAPTSGGGSGVFG